MNFKNKNKSILGMAWNCGMSYDEIEGKMNRLLKKPNTNKMFIMEMMAEFGEPNYVAMMVIVKILYDWDYDFERDCHDENYKAPECDEDTIKKMGEKINERGGLQAMQQNYYTMMHFMNPGMGNYIKGNDDPERLWKAKLKHVECVWSGVGDWRM